MVLRLSQQAGTAQRANRLLMAWFKMRWKSCKTGHQTLVFQNPCLPLTAAWHWNSMMTKVSPGEALNSMANIKRCLQSSPARNC